MAPEMLLESLRLSGRMASLRPAPFSARRASYALESEYAMDGRADAYRSGGAAHQRAVAASPRQGNCSKELFAMPMAIPDAIADAAAVSGFRLA